MPTTSNFGWTTPADTDLVKDGAAAIRTLGNGIDTSLLDLKGGTTGQILSKNSNTDLDYTWVTPNVGDITEVQAGTGISIADGTGPIPVVTNTVATEFDAKGDLIVGTGSDTFDRLAVGTNGYTLVANSSTSTGLEWQAPAGGGKVLQVVQGTLTSAASTTSTSMVDTGLTVSITPSSATSKVYVIASFYGYVARSGSQTTNYGDFDLLRGATVLQNQQPGQVNFASASGNEFNASINFSYLDSPATTSSTTYKIQHKALTSQTSWVSAAATRIASIIAMEIGA